MLAPVSTTDRIVRRIASSEMERRRTLMRDHMRAIGVQVAVALASEDFLGGTIRWLSDRPATNAYHTVVLFHADSPMTVIEHGPLDGHRIVTDHPEYVGTEEVFSTTSWRSIRYTYEKEARIASDVIRHRGYRRVGIIGGGAMPHAFITALMGGGVETVDITDFVDRCKAVKSDVELAEIRATAEMQDEIFAALLEQIEPGMRDLDVMALAQYEGRRRGSEQGVFLVSSQSLGRPTLLAPPHFQGRRFERGEHLSLLIENNGSAGYYTELGRTVVLGKATSQLLDSMDLALDAQRNTLERLRPGAACADIARAHDAFMDAHGLDRENRLYAHGQGYDLVESPLIRADDPTSLQAGMNMAVHPSFVVSGAFGFVCDNYVVQPSGPPLPLHRTEQRIFEI